MVVYTIEESKPLQWFWFKVILQKEMQVGISFWMLKIISS